MTREDAIEQLQNCKAHAIADGFEEALDMAIEALSAETDTEQSETHEIHTETHECVKETHDSDLIRRADVLKYPIRLDHYDEENGNRVFVYGVESVIEYVEALPSADTEPKWNCTANFVAEQLERLRNMTDDEKWEFFKSFFEMKGGAE